MYEARMRLPSRLSAVLFVAVATACGRDVRASVVHCECASSPVSAQAFDGGRSTGDARADDG